MIGSVIAAAGALVLLAVSHSSAFAQESADASYKSPPTPRLPDGTVDLGGGHVWREIHMDGRPHPEGDALNPTYFGHSVGHWQGDTLVVDTVGRDFDPRHRR